VANQTEDIISIAAALAEPRPDMLTGASLFLDLDGTLVDIVDRPDEVVADDELRNLLVRVAARLDGRLAIVSGRSLAQMDGMLGSVAEGIALSGSHGSEHRWKGVSAHPMRPAALETAASRFQARLGSIDGVLVEEKSFGVALHYRLAPHVEAEASRLAEDLAEELELAVQPGKMMVEVRVAGGDKGTAVRRLMSRPPMNGTIPVFVGDDVTDEFGFAAAQELGGAGILVGDRHPTEARYALHNPSAVRSWLRAFAG
jgi:trehalose 6-phosphate phosphatase